VIGLVATLLLAAAGSAAAERTVAAGEPAAAVLNTVTPAELARLSVAVARPSVNPLCQVPLPLHPACPLSREAALKHAPPGRVDEAALADVSAPAVSHRLAWLVVLNGFPTPAWSMGRPALYLPVRRLVVLDAGNGAQLLQLTLSSPGCGSPVPGRPCRPPLPTFLEGGPRPGA